MAWSLGRCDVTHGTACYTLGLPRLPRIANFDDLDPLAAEPDVVIDLVTPGRALPGDADVVLLPGSKATLADLAALRREGWDIDLRAHWRRGGRVIGLCGGYQMLGRTIADPHGVEGAPASGDGLGLLDVATVLDSSKIVRAVCGHAAGSGIALGGYEIHAGATDGPDRTRPMVLLDHGPDGATSADGRVEGCYVHGLFAGDAFRRQWLDGLRAARGLTSPANAIGFEAQIEDTLDRLADHIAAAVDLDRVLEIARAR